MILKLMENVTVASDLNTSAFYIDKFSKIFTGQYNPTTKIAATGPNSSTSYQKTVIFCSFDGVGVDYIGQVVLTNLNWRGSTIITDPSIGWLAFCPGNGTWNIGSQTLTIAGDTVFSNNGATNGISGICASVERN